MGCKMFSYMGFLLSVQTLLTLNVFWKNILFACFALGVLSLFHCIPEWQQIGVLNIKWIKIGLLVCTYTLQCIRMGIMKLATWLKISDFAWIALFQLNNAINSGLLYNNRNNENCLFLVKLCSVHKQVGDKMSGVYFKNNIVTDSLL